MLPQFERIRRYEQAIFKGAFKEAVKTRRKFDLGEELRWAHEHAIFVVRRTAGIEETKDIEVG